MPTQLASDVSINRTITKNLDALRKPGVLVVRPGYEIADGRLTGSSAVVVTVHTKRNPADLAPGEKLPDQLDGVPVDVREATGLQRLRAHDPMAAAISKAYGRPENAEPYWPYQREMPSGNLLDSASSTASKVVARHAARGTAAHKVLAARTRSTSKPQINYVPANQPVTPITTTATVTAAVSPEGGWSTLQSFLGKTRKSLVVGMYDFTSGHILAEFEKVLVGETTLTMVLDNPAPNDTRDQLDIQTAEELRTALGSRARIVHALTASDPYVTRKIFPSAYHIKVIVRDSAAIWLSSGNLNNSNEPDSESPPHTEDRDWHIVVDDPKVAQVFEAYIEQDYASALPNQVSANDAKAVEEAAIVKDAEAKRKAEANPPRPGTTRPSKVPVRVPAQTFQSERLTLTPLLTPDKLPGGKGQYLSAILALINGAEKSLWLQLQYIEASKGDGSDYDLLLQALQARAKEPDFDLRLLQNGHWGQPWAEKMKATGVDLTPWIRMQPNVHNKGFVIDGHTVVVSSQNFSPQGTDANRDAGLILESARLAGFYGPIFESDWDQSKPFAPKGQTAHPEPKAPSPARFNEAQGHAGHAEIR